MKVYKSHKYQTLFINYDFLLADGGQNYSKIAIKAL